MASFGSWLARIVQILTGKPHKQAENRQEKPLLSDAEDLEPTKRYEAFSFKEQARPSQAYLRLGSEVILLQAVFLVGRGASCHLRLADPKASRVHASFMPVGASWVVQDNASKNGTFLNGRRIKRALLKPGDTIRIGQTVLTYEER